MKLSIITSSIFLLSIFGIYTLMNEQNDSYRSISVEDVRNFIEEGETITLLDVRTPEEFHGPLGHLPNAHLLPVQEISSRYSELEKINDKHIVVYCRTDNRSRIAAQFLIEEHGYENVSVMLGGMVEWNKKYGKPEN